MTNAWRVFASSLVVFCVSYFCFNWFVWLPQVSSGACHKKPTKLTGVLSSMSPYRFVANANDSTVSFEGCHATNFWGMFRHGTRNPTGKLIQDAQLMLPILRDQIVTLHQEGKGFLCKPEISELQEWKFDIAVDEAKVLAIEGGNEHRELGIRFRNRFPELLSNPYDRSYYEFYYTSTPRTEESAVNFAVGLFGKEDGSRVEFKNTSESNSFLRFYKTCDKWRKEIKDSLDSRVEKTTFENGPEVAQVRQKVSRRLGFNHVLSVDVITTMYLVCAYGTALDKSKPSAWCNPFTEDELEVMEYIKDLNHYAKSGYMAEITYKQACTTVKNVFDYFSSSTSQNPRVKLHFAHSGTMLKFLARLGLYSKPLHLYAKDFRSNLNREWKGSRIDTFAANIVFVLYNCGGEKKVLTLHQEKAIKLPGCPNPPELCPLQNILKQYQDILNNCDLPAMCSLDKTS